MKQDAPTVPRLFASITGEDGSRLEYKQYVTLGDSLPDIPRADTLIEPLRTTLEQMIEAPERDMDHIRAIAVALSKLKDTATAPKLLRLLEEEKDGFYAVEYVWCLSNIGEQAFRDGINTYLDLRGKAREEKEKQLDIPHTIDASHAQQALVPQYPQLISFYLEAYPIAATEVLLEFLSQKDYPNPWPIPDEILGVLKLKEFDKYLGHGYETAMKHPIISRVVDFMKSTEDTLGTNHPSFRGAAYVLVNTFPIKQDYELLKQELKPNGKEALDTERSIFAGDENGNY